MELLFTDLLTGGMVDMARSNGIGSSGANRHAFSFKDVKIIVEYIQCERVYIPQTTGMYEDP